MSVTDELIAISDRSNSILLLSLPAALDPSLPTTIQSNSSAMNSIALRALHTYTSGGEIIDVAAGVTCLVFGVNMHGRTKIEGRVIVQASIKEHL